MKKSCLGLAMAALALAPVELSAKEISLGVRPIAPYVVQGEGDKVSGLEYEIVAAALAVKGHTLKPTLLPFARLVATFKEGSLDAAVPVLPSFNTGGTLTDSHLTYNNIALSLADKKASVAGVADLAALKVMAFQNASSALGAEYAAAVAKSPEYREEAKQVLQVKSLFADRVDVIVGERRILRHYLQSPESGVDASKPVVEHPIFPALAYAVVFKDAALASDFNEGLKAIKANGTYDQLLKRYGDK